MEYLNNNFYELSNEEAMVTDGGVGYAAVFGAVAFSTAVIGIAGFALGYVYEISIM